MLQTIRERKLMDLASLVTPMLPFSMTVNSFYEAIAKPNFSLIAEYKQQTFAGEKLTSIGPSTLCQDDYAAGASALSILTDSTYFNGHFGHLASVAQFTQPRLCKDFIVTQRQIELAKLYGASAVLLIVGLNTPQQTKQLFTHAKLYQLDVLVETHNIDQIDEALELGANIIGVNNRDFESAKQQNYTPTIRRCEALIDYGKQQSSNALFVAESGISSREHIRRVESLGFDGALVGSYLLKTKNRKRAIRELLGTTV